MVARCHRARREDLRDREPECRHLNVLRQRLVQRNTKSRSKALKENVRCEHAKLPCCSKRLEFLEYCFQDVQSIYPAHLKSVSSTSHLGLLSVLSEPAVRAAGRSMNFR